jgi:hypothetical protein
MPLGPYWLLPLDLTGRLIAIGLWSYALECGKKLWKIIDEQHGDGSLGP